MDNIHDVYIANLWDWVQEHYSMDEERWQFLETDPVVTQALKKVISILCHSLDSWITAWCMLTMLHV